MGPTRERVLACLLALACAVAVTACGGSGPTAQITAPAHITEKAGLLGTAQSAGHARSDAPAGRLLADSGFRAQRNGFAFENYGNDAGPVNLTAANVEDLFGSAVCADPDASQCVLIPQARYWMAQVNASMADGHCMGFSVTALRFFAHNLSPETYGARTTIGLPIVGNRALQSLIAEDFAYQDLPAVTDRAVQGTPAHVVSALVSALRNRRQAYTLAILKPDGTGGHAITPFAVIDRGHGQDAVLVYDNNFPGVVRSVSVDTVHNTWRYVGGINPSDTSEIYTGDARTQTMLLLPTSPGEHQQPCPFCSAHNAAPGAPTEVDRLHYIEVSLTASGAEHPHLLFIDPEGRRSGFSGGRLINQIPGVQIVSNYSVQNWRAAPEPVYHLPLNHPDLRVLVDGTGLTHAVRPKVQVNGAGLVFYVQDIHMAPRQQDAMLIAHGDLSLTYATGGTFPGSPTLFTQFPQIVTGTRHARLMTIGAGWIGYRPGSPVTLTVHPAQATAEVSSAGDQALVKSARYIVSTDSSPVGAGFSERSYLGSDLALNGTTRQTATFPYLQPTGRTLAVHLAGTRGPAGVLQLPASH